MAYKRKSVCVLPFIAGIVLLCPFCIASAEGDVTLVKLARKVRPAVVLIETFDKDKKRIGQGSGFFINDKSHLITNYHVLKGVYSAEVKTYDGKAYPVKLVLAENESMDLIKVLVAIPEKAVKFVQVTKTVPEVAERVLVVGSPLGLEQTVSEGIVSAIRDIPAIGKIFQISAPISSGSSGSPVVNMKGQVIGVATFQSIEGQNLNFAVSGENVLALKSEKKGKTLKEWTLDVSNKQTKSARNLHQKGIKFIWIGEYEKALNYFKKALEVDSGYESAWDGIWCCYWVRGQHGELLETSKQLIRIYPDSVMAYCGLGRAYSGLGRFQEAVEACKQAIKIDPDCALGHCYLGKAYSMLHEYEEAIEALKQAIRINSAYADAHYSLGLIYLWNGDRSSALEEYKILKTLDKDLADQFFSLIYK